MDMYIFKTSNNQRLLTFDIRSKMVTLNATCFSQQNFVINRPKNENKK